MTQATVAGKPLKGPSNNPITQLAEKHAKLGTDCWKILGVPDGASMDELETAYKRLAATGSLLPEMKVAYEVAKNASLLKTYISALFTAQRSIEETRAKLGRTGGHSLTALHWQAHSLKLDDAITLSKDAALIGAGFSTEAYTRSKKAMAVSSRPPDAVIKTHRRLLAQKSLYLLELEKSAWELLGFERGFNFLVQAEYATEAEVLELFTKKVGEILSEAKRADLLDKHLETYLALILRGLLREIAKQWNELQQEELKIAHFNTGSET